MVYYNLIKQSANYERIIWQYLSKRPIGHAHEKAMYRHYKFFKAKIYNAEKNTVYLT